MSPSRFLVACSWLCLLWTGCLAVDRDKHANCAEWASVGECDKNPSFMKTQCAASCWKVEQAEKESAKEIEAIGSFFDLSAKDLDGNDFQFASLRGQVTVLTNVASQCGYTASHYKSLVELYGATANQPVTILAFPCNQFGKQEPGSADEIKDFASRKGVEFKMMEKIEVNGPGTHVVYKYLKYHTGTTAIGWNFATYFVVDPDGTGVSAFHGVEPMDLLDLILEKAGAEGEL
jgi:glutathione peroxidase-family protein